MVLLSPKNYFDVRAIVDCGPARRTGFFRLDKKIGRLNALFLDGMLAA